MVGKEKQFAYSQESTWVKASLSLCCRWVYDIHVKVYDVDVYLYDVDADAYRNSDITVGGGFRRQTRQDSLKFQTLLVQSFAHYLQLVTSCIFEIFTSIFKVLLILTLLCTKLYVNMEIWYHVVRTDGLGSPCLFFFSSLRPFYASTYGFDIAYLLFTCLPIHFSCVFSRMPACLQCHHLPVTVEISCSLNLSYVQLF